MSDSYPTVFCSVTNETIFISKTENDEYCMDVIQLHQISSVIKQDGTDQQGRQYYGFELLLAETGTYTQHHLVQWQFRSTEGVIRGQWVMTLLELSEAERERHRPTQLQEAKQWCKRLHDRPQVEKFFTAVVVLAFGLAIAEDEIVPERGSDQQKMFARVDMVVTTLFGLEILLAFLAHAGKEYFQDGWRMFDAFILAISVASLALTNVKSIRALRVLRVLRLTKKFRNLKAILHAVYGSIPAVMHSLVIFGLFTLIYASVGVGLFGQQDPVLFGNLSRSLFSVLQIGLLQDSWASQIENMMGKSSGKEAQGRQSALPAVFLVSYVLLCGLVLINVVVAVMLESFLSVMLRERAEIRRQDVIEHDPRMGENHTIDPLLKTLTKFRSAADLEDQIDLVFATINERHNGSVNMAEFCGRLPQICPDIPHFPVEDWYDITDILCKDRPGTKTAPNADLEISPDDFKLICKSQLKDFLLRESNKARAGSGDEFAAKLMLIKWIMLKLDRAGWLQKPRNTAAIYESLVRRDQRARVTARFVAKSPSVVSSV